MKKKTFGILTVATFCLTIAFAAMPRPTKAYHILLNDFSGCWNSGGNCLPEIIVRPKK